MESFFTAAVIWFLIGFVCFLLEFVVPGLILFFFAVGAWIVAILSLFVDMDINTQLVIFLACSVLTILFFRNWVKKIIQTKKHPTELADEIIGKTGIAATFIGPGQNGKIDFKGTHWEAQSADTIQQGETVVIIGNDSILLIVQSIKTIS